MGCFPGLFLIILGAYCGTILPAWAFWPLAVVLLVVGFAGPFVATVDSVPHQLFAAFALLSTWFLCGLVLAHLVGVYDTGITLEFTPRNWNTETL